MNREFMYNLLLWEFTGKSTISLISHCLTGLKRLPDQYKLNQVHYISKCTSLILYNKHFISTERKVHVHINVPCKMYIATGIQSNLNVSDVDPQVILVIWTCNTCTGIKHFELHYRSNKRYCKQAHK